MFIILNKKEIMTKRNFWSFYAQLNILVGLLISKVTVLVKHTLYRIALNFLPPGRRVELI